VTLKDSELRMENAPNIRIARVPAPSRVFPDTAQHKIE
jgi:hypothetical protein